MYNKKTFLIDSENVGTDWKKILPCREKRDRIIIFYTDNTPNLSYADLLDIIQYPDAFESIKCNTGKDALDFQLVSYLGFLIKSSPKTDYYIVSKDTGYDSVCKFWCDMDSSISLQRIDSSISPYKQKTSPSSKPEKKKLETSLNIEEEKSEEVSLQVIQDVLPKHYKTSESVNQIFEVLKNFDQGDLQQIHRNLVKQFGQENGAAIYRTIKPHFSKIYETIG